MKRLLGLFVFLIISLALQANPVTNEPFSFTQPDGSKIEAFVSGDEFYRRVHDERGYTILLHPETGYAVYAVPEVNSIKASNYIVGKIDPGTIGIEPNLILNEQKSEAELVAQGFNVNRTRSTTIGSFNNIVIFVKFSGEYGFSTVYPYAYYNYVFNQTNGESLKDYFQEISSNQLTINSYLYPAPGPQGTVATYVSTHPRGYFYPYSTGNPIGYQNGTQAGNRKRELYADAINAAIPSIPSTLNVDTNNDNMVDAVTVIVDGYAGGWSSLIWPSSDWWGTSLATINGKACHGGMLLVEGGFGIGVATHEMSHNIGAPDLYHYKQYQPWNSISPAGNWDLMCSGNAQHWTTFMKKKYGNWFTEIPEIVPTSTPVTYTLSSIDTSPYACYKIASSNPDQYYMLEYRRKTGRYESSVPGSGLIVYRIIVNDPAGNPILGGNRNGAPDELYVYRPGGSIRTNGYPDLANFSEQTERVSINNNTDPKPWLYVGTVNIATGNLIISNIGASGGSSISFTVCTIPPDIWTGAVDTNWFNSSNWTMGVPTSTMDVVIGTTVNYPAINSVGAVCRNLSISSGRRLTVNDGNLHIYGKFETAGLLSLNHNNALIVLDGDALWKSSSRLFSYGEFTGAHFQVAGNWTTNSGSTIEMLGGTLEFNGDQFTTYLDNSSTQTYLNLLRINKGSPGYMGFSVWSTNMTNLNNIEIVSGGMYYYSPQTINISGSFSCTGGNFGFVDGTLIFTGSGNHSISDGTANNYFSGIRIETTGPVTLNNSITINKDLTLVSGIFSANGQTIRVSGNWTDISGGTSFDHGNGRVIFTGSNVQTCSFGYFSAMELDKSAEYLNLTGSVTCQSYDWTAGVVRVEGGAFTAADLADDGIYGEYHLQSGTIDLHQDAFNYLDLRGLIEITGGTMTFYGGSGDAYFPYGQPGTLIMTNGILDFVDVGIYINEYNTLTTDITGGVIRTRGNFVVDRHDFRPTGGSLELYGANDVYLTVASSSWLYSLNINKQAGSYSEYRTNNRRSISRNRDRVERNQDVSINSSPLVLLGNFAVNAGTVTLPTDTYVAGNWENQAGSDAVTEGSGTVIFNGPGHQYCSYSEIFNRLVINKAGGALRISNGAVVSCQTYYFTSGALDMLSGTFTANDLEQDGIYGNYYVNSGSVINLHQDGSSYSDLNGNLYIFGGEFNIYGGLSPAQVGYNANSSINMSGGVLDFKDTGINITNTGFSFTENITDGTIRTVGNFYCGNPNFHPQGGILELYGSGNAGIYTITGSNLYSVSINKTEGRRLAKQYSAKQRTNSRRQEVQDYRYEGAYFSSNTNILGNLTLFAGILDIDGYTVEVGGNTVIYGCLRMISETGNDNLNTHGNFQWLSSSTAEITTGNIDVYGDWTFDSFANINLPATSTVEFRSVNGSNIYLNGTNCSFGNMRFCGTSGGRTNYIDPASTDSLRVSGYLNVYDGNTLYLNGRGTRVNDFIYIGVSANLSLGLTGSLLGKGSLNQMGTLNISNGNMVIKGYYLNNTGSSLIVNGGLFQIDDAFPEPNVSINGAVTMASGIIQFTNSGMILTSDAKNITGGYLRCKGDFNARSNNMIQQVYGGVDISGDGQAFIYCDNGNYMGSLAMNKESGSTLNVMTPLDIRGNVILNSGTLDGREYNINVGGNWQNNSGAFAFNAGTGTITFNGTSVEQFITGPNTFNHVYASTNNVNFVTFNSVTTIRGSLHVNNLARTSSDLFIQGTLEMNNSWAQFHALTGSNIQTASFDGGGTIFISGGTMDVQDLVDNGIYGNYFVSSGVLSLTQDPLQAIDINGGLFISGGVLNIYGGSNNSYVSNYADATITMTDGVLAIHDRGMILSTSGGHNFTSNISGGTIKINGAFQNYRNNFIPTGGTVEFFGSNSGNVIQTGDSRFWNININKSSGASVSAGTNLTIANDVVISNGWMMVGTATLYVGGSWENNVGTLAFSEGTGNVVFNGINQDMRTSETFYDLTIANTGIHFDDLELLHDKTITVSRNLTLNDGTIEMNANSGLIVNGNILIAEGAGINAYGDGGLSLTLGGNFTNQNTINDSWNGFFTDASTFTFNGSADQFISSTGDVIDMGNIDVNKAAGSIRPNKSMLVQGNVHLINGGWWDNVSNLNHHFFGNFAVEANAGFYGNTLNSVSFNGTAAQTLAYYSTSGYFYNLEVDKTEARFASVLASANAEAAPAQSRHSRNQTMTLGGNIQVFNGGVLSINQGRLDMNGHNIQCIGSVSVHDGGILEIDSDATLRINSNMNLTVLSGGRLEVLGSADHPATITHNNGYYDLIVSSAGTIAAAYAVFEFMNTNGVYISPGALIDASYTFNNCTFQNGISGGVLLTLDNSQTLSISNAVFPSNTWSGLNNVSKTVNEGSVSIISSTGGFAGPGFENDTYGLISWTGFNPNLRISAMTISNSNPFVGQIVSYRVTVINEGTTDINRTFNVHLYTNRTTPPTEGDFSTINHEFSGLAAGDTISFVFEGISASEVIGWNSYAFVDPENLVTETNENDNASTVCPVDWNAFPAVSDVSISYDANTARVFLQWTHPLSEAHFHIYRSLDPQGTFELIDNTTNYLWYDSVPGDKYFYRVTASID